MPDPVIILPYDPEWPGLFRQAAGTLRQALGGTALRIDHVGSTAVPGLAAKPVIDIQISVKSFQPEEAYRIPLESLGYIFRPDNPDRSKRYFREGPGMRRTHIHVRQAGSWSEQLNLLYRDYLRSHPEEARRYAEMKSALAERYGEDRAGYTEAKAPFIWELLHKADLWCQKTGWQAGETDA